MFGIGAITGVLSSPVLLCRPRSPHWLLHTFHWIPGAVHPMQSLSVGVPTSLANWNPPCVASLLIQRKGILGVQAVLSSLLSSGHQSGSPPEPRFVQTSMAQKSPGHLCKALWGVSLKTCLLMCHRVEPKHHPPTGGWWAEDKVTVTACSQPSK